MAENNGWTKWLVATLYTAIITALIMTAQGVVANDKDSRARDTEISKDVAGVKSDIASIKTSIDYIREDSKAIRKAFKI